MHRAQQTLSNLTASDDQETCCISTEVLDNVPRVGRDFGNVEPSGHRGRYLKNKLP